MGTIEELPSVLVNQIAAGEVIERPSSVVKELIENALDADAEEVNVELKKGGKKYIRVEDDGTGIRFDDLELALKSHATSKIKKQEELQEIHTLGFRGEALASIASVSDLTLISRPEDADTAGKIRAKGGEIMDPEPMSAPPGTSVVVKNLFYHTPARKKFLKNVGTEFGRCTDVITSFALAHPSVRFEVDHNGNRVFTLPATDTPRDRIERFWSSNIADSLIEYTVDDELVTARGYISPPSLYRSNTKLMRFFFNGREIENRTLFTAVKNAYQGILPPKKYPVLFLFLRVPPKTVDVNVHPTKKEVRFRKKWKLRSLLEETLRETVLEQKSTPTIKGSLEEEQTGASNGIGENDSSATDERVKKAIDDFFRGRESTGDEGKTDPTEQTRRTTSVLPRERISKALQIHDSYIVQEVEDGIVLIDQHALHERIQYHKLHERLKNQNIPRQNLLTPAVVEVSSVLSETLEDVQQSLKQLGFEVESFGRNSVAVRSIPALLDGKAPGDLLTETLEDLQENVGENESHGEVDQILRLIACHSAIKAGDSLQPEEIENLLEQKQRIQTDHACVHGRPTTLKLTLEELEKRFHRK